MITFSPSRRAVVEPGLDWESEANALNKLLDFIARSFGLPNGPVRGSDRSYNYETGRIDMRLRPFSAANPHAHHWKANRGAR